MPFELPSLPYDYDALEPYLSRETMRVHHSVLQRDYVKTLNNLVRGTTYDHLPLEQLIMSAQDEAVYDNAAQTWNHTFSWYSMMPKGGEAPSKSSGFGQAVATLFGSHGQFKRAFKEKAREVFGSAWVWVLADQSGNVMLWIGEDADNPMRHGYRPLLCCDVWEHAFFLDYPGDRKGYIDAFLEHLVNWRFAETNYERAFGI